MTRAAWAAARTGLTMGDLPRGAVVVLCRVCHCYQLAEVDRGGVLVVERHGAPCSGGRMAVAQVEAMARRDGPVTA